MIAKLDDEFNSRKKEACLAKQKDHYGFQIHKNDINTRVEMRKSNRFTPYIQQQRVWVKLVAASLKQFPIMNVRRFVGIITTQLYFTTLIQVTYFLKFKDFSRTTFLNFKDLIYYFLH